MGKKKERKKKRMHFEFFSLPLPSPFPSFTSILHKVIRGKEGLAENLLIISEEKIKINK